MRLLQLARTAWDAEALYLRRQVRAHGFQAGYAAVAVVFALMLLVMLHITAFVALLPSQGPVWSALIVGFVDLMLLALFGWLASRAGHDPVALEARLIRKEAMRQMGDSAARVAVLAPLLKSQSVKKGFAGAAVTALAVGLLSRR